MHKRILQTFTLLFLAALIITALRPPSSNAAAANQAGANIAEAFQAAPTPSVLEPTPAAEDPDLSLLAVQQAASPVFRYPVVPGAVISGYFDHQNAGGIVHHYNGRQNAPGAGYYFQCPSVYMNDWVGCQDAVAGEPGCSNSREVWYDGHHGTDYEFATNWHTGAVCDPARFAGITMPIYAPAKGRVLMAGTDPNRWANGWHIRLQHDLNNNGNYDDDMFRSIYLHFTANQLAVSPGQIIPEGAYLGLGGSTGYSSSPHLHFEVQRSANYFNTYWPVDPYGWQAPGADPYPYTNIVLFRLPPPVDYTDFLYMPAVFNTQVGCVNCGELLRNGGFEQGGSEWSESGVDIIVSTSYPNLPINPHGGSWLAWTGGRDYASDSISQSFTVPSGARNAVLRYYLYVTTTESGGVFDTFVARLREANGNVIQELDKADNTFGSPNTWVLREIAFSLDGRQGQTLTLQLKGMTDGSNKSSFYIDDLSLTVSE